MYYTTDGTTPTTQSAQYSGPITVSTTETIQAFAVAPGYSSSPTESERYDVYINLAPSPTFNPPLGNYSTPQQVTISDSVAGATIYYTVDGSTPTTNSTQYSAPITVSTTETIIAIAAAPGYSTSFTSSATYTFPAPSPSNTWANVRGTNALAQTGIYGMLGYPLGQN